MQHNNVLNLTILNITLILKKINKFYGGYKMAQKIITIDENKCVGCGLCVNACQQSAILLVEGKAKLVREDYCDGLGNCLPVCPTNAINFEDKVEPSKEPVKNHNVSSGCPGATATVLNNNISKSLDNKINTTFEPINMQSRLSNWPVQIKLVPTKAPFYDEANLLISADCCAYAYNNFHNEFIKNKITVIGCPKLDSVDYSEKLCEIIKNNEIKSVTIVKMEVPCCTGLYLATKNALINSGKMIPWQVVTISRDGQILE